MDIKIYTEKGTSSFYVPAGAVLTGWKESFRPNPTYRGGWDFRFRLLDGSDYFVNCTGAVYQTWEDGVPKPFDPRPRKEWLVDGGVPSIVSSSVSHFFGVKG